MSLAAAVYGAANGIRGFVIWWIAYSLREQGRFQEALVAARQLRRFPKQGQWPGALDQTSA